MHPHNNTYKTLHTYIYYTARYLLISCGSNKLSCSLEASSSSGDCPKSGDAFASKDQKCLFVFSAH